MLTAVIALFVRILSNPLANLLQKILVQKHSAILINTYSYLSLSLVCLIPVLSNDWSGYNLTYWLYALFAGILCTLGSVCLIKALQIGEMSVLGPINSYKCIVGLLFGWVILGEMPTVSGLIGMLLIIFGSWFIFDTMEEGFTFKLLLRKDIVLRFCALFFTGCEAVVLKKIILMSSVLESFYLWCFTGFIFSLILLFAFRIKPEKFSSNNLILCCGIAACLGLMQLSTNIVLEKLNVGLSLALFQLSSIVAVVFGYKVFNEEHFLKKLFGSIIMIVGSCLILLL
ncbi:MAG: DMT family transporter [Muribaculaceae bacterium]|nr:DMT family transporter [Muribaculaceae bacterium]